MDFLKAPLTFIEGYGGNIAFVLLALGFGLFILVYNLLDIELAGTIRWMVTTVPLWLPFATFMLFFHHWMDFVQKKFDLNQGRVTLEILVPQEIFKSPEAMELVLIQLHQTATPDNHVQTYWDGKHPPVYGLEIVSRHGEVRFYMNVPRKKFKNIAETQLYAQYPGVEVRELDIDYTAEIPWDPSTYSYFSIHFGPKKADAYPIKTYIEYGLDRMPKEEEKVDPISSMIEMLASIGKDEFAWMQILITAHRETNFKVGALHAAPDWKVDAKAEITKIIEEAQKRTKTEQMNMMNLTETEKATIAAIERSISKNAFNTAIRSMYIAKKDAYAPGERIGAIITGWRGYDDLNRNAIGVRWRTDFDWNWWQDPKEKRRTAFKKQELDEYKRRYYTHQNSLDKLKVMTTEEIATMFHLPGKFVLSPTLSRIPSKRGEAPGNLPV